jgi:hypothetical protein
MLSFETPGSVLSMFRDKVKEGSVYQDEDTRPKYETRRKAEKSQGCGRGDVVATLCKATKRLLLHVACIATSLWMRLWAERKVKRRQQQPNLWRIFMPVAFAYPG